MFETLWLLAQQAPPVTASSEPLSTGAIVAIVGGAIGGGGGLWASVKAFMAWLAGQLEHKDAEIAKLRDVIAGYSSAIDKVVKDGNAREDALRIEYNARLDKLQGKYLDWLEDIKRVPVAPAKP